MKRLLLSLAVVLSVLPARAGDVAARLRTELEAMDYETVVREADAILAAHPDDNEVRAVRLTARVLLSQSTKDEAEWMVRAYPNDPWSWYARSLTALYTG